MYPRKENLWFFVCFSFWLAIACNPVHAFQNEAFFESKIRPIFEEHCIECHGGRQPKGDLNLEFRSGWENSGVVEPGNPNASSLMAAVGYEDPDIAMPPKDKGGKLSDAKIRAIEEWIAMGAPDPRVNPVEDSVTKNGPQKRPRRFSITEQDRTHWAYQPIPATALNQPKSIAVSAQNIDRIVRDSYSEKQISANERATPRELVRRAYFDLWGLPPSPDEVERFESSPTEEAWAALIDRLLASPHYGERWGRHWLDLVRFAESNGYERDGAKPNAWRYRDYVIRSFNEDKPYDQFVIEQLAGDEWAATKGINSHSDFDRWSQSITATAFYRLHVWDDEPDSTAVAEMDDLDDIVVTTSATFLGMTYGCARCHDHKYDPVSQSDYYSLVSYLRGIDPYGLSKTGGGGRGTGRIQRYLALPEEVTKWQLEHDNQIKQTEKSIAEESNPEKKRELETKLQHLRNSPAPLPATLAAVENGPELKPTFILARGDIHSPKEEVSPRIPQIFDAISPLPAETIERVPEAESSGRRLALARWIANERNPLTARVIANRIWQHHFGVGIVPTPDDFGYTGIGPTNLHLLDFLARDLIDNQWRLKSLHRAIMNSKTYQLASHQNNKHATAVDSDNQLFWRQNLRRLEAESVRDAILSVSGALNAKRDGPSVFVTLSDQVRSAANPVSSQDWVDSPADQQNCRSVFLVVKRALKVPLLDSLDFANSTSPLGFRTVTTTAPQALMLLNDQFMQQQSHELARRAEQTIGEDINQQLHYLFRLLYQRPPTHEEIKACTSFLEKQREQAKLDGHATPNAFAIESLCLSLLNANELIYID